MINTFWGLLKGGPDLEAPRPILELLVGGFLLGACVVQPILRITGPLIGGPT